MTFDLDAYLNRLENPTRGAGVETLAVLQRAQMQHIVFEYIDVLLGDIPALDISSLTQKLIVQNRGGYCLELNTLFGAALSALGFKVTPFLGRVRRESATGGARTHFALIVNADGEDWLCDTGFGGGGAPAPLRLNNREPVNLGGAHYRLTDDAATGETVLEIKRDGSWVSLYGFDQANINEPEIEAANFLCARWPQSPFPANLMMTRLTDTGRINVFNLSGKRITKDGVEPFEIKTLGQLTELLAEDFDLSLPHAQIEKVWQRLSTA